MSPAELERIRQLLSASLDAPADEPFHGQAELDAFFAAHPSAPAFLDHSLPHLLGLAPPDPPDHTGATLSQRYVLTSRLTRTGFATVYLAHDLAVFRKPVIVKILDQLGADPVARRMFQAELESLAVIEHPGVVGISNTGLTPEGIPFLVLDYVAGPTLRELLAAGPLPLPRALAILKDLCRALTAAHRAGVAHLDLKPENIIISEPRTSRERATILDFGIARLRSSSAEWIAAGSVRYMAPEQAANPTVRSDVYSLGLVACEMLTGRLPAPGDRPPLPALALALEPDPARRYPSAEELGAALESQPLPRRSWPWLALAAVLVTVPSVFYLTRPPAAVYPPPVPLVTRAGFDQDPAFSADGQWLYFAAGPVDFSDIYRQSTAGGSPVPLVKEPTDDVLPRPTPDGASFTFIRREKLPQHNGLWIQSLAPGSKPRILFEAPYLDNYTWSPDGRFLHFTYRLVAGSPFVLGRLNVADWRWEHVMSAPAGAGIHSPAISPNGRHLAYVLRAGRGGNVYVVPISPDGKLTGNPRQLTEGDDRLSGPQWTPDSRELLYLRGPWDSGVIWRVSLAGGAPVRTAVSSQPVDSFAIAPRHWKLAFTVDLSANNIWRYDLTRAGPAALEPVITSSANDEEPSLSPDGRSIAFGSTRTGRQQIWVADRDGQNPWQVTNLQGKHSASVEWSPDSQSLFISVHQGKSPTIYRTSAARPYSAQPEPLAPYLDNSALIGFAPNGKSFYVVRFQNAVPEIWQVPYPALSPAVRLPLPGAHYILESPSENALYYSLSGGADGIWRYALDRPGDPPQLYIPQIQFRSSFAVGRDGIYYVAPVSGPSLGLYFRPFRAEAPLLLHRFAHQLAWGFRLSADEKALYFSQTDSANSDIYLVEPFR